MPDCRSCLELTVREIIIQQVSVAAASTLAGRLVHSFGTQATMTALVTHLFPRAEVLAQADVATIGLPEARAKTIRLLARAVAERRICFDAVANHEAFQAA